MISFKQHKELGLALYALYRKMQTVICDDQSQKEKKLERSIIKRIDALRNLLDDLLARDHPEIPGSELKKTYYNVQLDNNISKVNI
jgi:hypothetical protein